jgi:SnoaL-like domain
MPTAETLERFIARVESGAHADAIAEFYAEDARMRENAGEPRVGRAVLVAHEQKVLGRASSVESTCVRPVLVSGSIVVVRWIFRFVWLDGTATQMEELAYQRWEGERIADEQFFYDPAQLRPREPVRT